MNSGTFNLSILIQSEETTERNCLGNATKPNSRLMNHRVCFYGCAAAVSVSGFHSFCASNVRRLLAGYLLLLLLNYSFQASILGFPPIGIIKIQIPEWQGNAKGVNDTTTKYNVTRHCIWHGTRGWCISFFFFFFEASEYGVSWRGE